MLELEVQGEPIRGSISQPDGSSRPFYGWLELANALEARRRGRGAERAERAHAPTLPQLRIV